MPRLLVHRLARQDVDRIADFIARHNLQAALRFVDASELAFGFLAENPRAGPRVEPPLASVPELRFWPLTPYRNYLVLYRPLPESGVEVFRVTHGARQWRELLSGE